MRLLKNALFLLAFVILGSSCNNDETGRIIVRLTDSPGDYDEVNIDLQGVQIHRSGGNQEDGWIDLDVNKGIYNLLDLTDGVETIIADSRIPAGNITQLRLILGDNNTLVMGDNVYELSTPSAQQSGLKLQIFQNLLEGLTYTVLLDFDAAMSVVEAGRSGKYLLKPVVKTVTEARDGAIEGTVLPASENVAVFAVIGEDTLGASYATENTASYFVGGLEEGTYDLVFDPGENSAYALDTIKGVSVTLGVITNEGEFTLTEK